MNVRAILATIALLAASGCSARQQSPAAPSPDHPASPLAAEAPAPGASATLGSGPGPVTDADGAAPGPGDALASPVAYTCPHHPKVMEAEAGECPYCGMELEATTSRQTSPLRQRDDLPDTGPGAAEDEEPADEEQDPADHQHGEHE